MADKFFYIIRDLYSIQSKISSSAAGVVVPQAVAHSLYGRSKKSFAADNAGSTEAPAGGDSVESGSVVAKNDEEDATPAGMAKGKLASISSFLKSDSGLIALWRRATEMQSLDEANQEKRRLSASEESGKRKEDISLEQMKELHPQDKELQEHRDRMNALEIQEINQEFDRRWRSKIEPNTALNLASRQSASTEEGKASLTQDKRQKDEDDDEDHSNANPKGSKQMKTEKVTKAKAPPRKSRSTTVAGADAAQESLSTEEPSSSSSQKPTDRSTYRHSVVLQPQQLQQADSYIMQPMQIQPTTGPQKPTTDVNQQLLDLYAQQNQSIDMMQNANIQRQQQQLLMQQQQAAQMSSLAFGPPGGYPSLFMHNNPGGPLQGFAPQAGVGTVPNFVPPLVYGSNYDNRQQARMPTESLGSLFDFALPQEDISFLSNSFQVTPMMMQENGAFTQQNAASAMPMGGNGRPLGGSRAPGTTMGDGGAPHPPSSAAAAGMSSPLSTSSSGHRRNLSTASQSPSTDTNSMFNLSPGLNSFMMSDENLMGAQATPNNLIRYLQLHHQQELQQHELQQQQDTQPLLNQQNSLIYDDYFPWSSFSTQQQPGL